MSLFFQSWTDQNAKGGKLTPAGFAKVAPGAGPRHFAFHPNGRYGYVINEITLTVTAFEWDEAKGKLMELQTITTLPVERGKGMSTAEVQVHPSGKFLYGSNRGHNTIAVFSIDQQTGKLKAVQHQSTLGKTPRNFSLDPTGKFLLAANQSSGDIFTFRINKNSGELKPTGHSVKIPFPVCVKFLDLSEWGLEELLAVLQRGEAHGFLELHGKGALIVEAKVDRDFANAQVGLHQ